MKKKMEVVAPLDGFETVLGWFVFSCIVVSLCTGCGVSASVYPIHERHTEEHYNKTGLKCLFVNCEGGQSHGS